MSYWEEYTSFPCIGGVEGEGVCPSEEETEEEPVESYMDKLAVWQLTSSVDDLTADMGASSSKGNTKEERHWTQVFCEDVVEPL